jgi:hypothetical protein
MYSIVECNLTKEGSFMMKHVLLAGMVLALAVAAVAQGTKHEEKKSGTVTVVITHEVKDYAAWKKIYDADDLNRSKAGFKNAGVYRDAKNPSWVSVIGEFPSAEAAESFTSNPKLREIMERGGVLGKPEIKVLTKAGS